MRLKKYEIRYLCITTVISFLWVVMLSYLSQSKDINQILGNFSPSKSLKLDVQHIMQWNLAVLFPTLIANNYFIKDYLKPGEVANIPNVTANLLAFQAARKEMEASGRIVRNATRGGKLEVFERADLDELFEEWKRRTI